MDVNLRTEQMNDCVALVPVGIYTQKVDAKKMVERVIKRIVDIIAGIVGCILLIPLTIGIFIAQRIIKDKRTNIL